MQRVKTEGELRGTEEQGRGTEEQQGALGAIIPRLTPASPAERAGHMLPREHQHQLSQAEQPSESRTKQLLAPAKPVPTFLLPRCRARPPL